MKATDKVLGAAFARYIRRRDPRCVLCGMPTSDCAHLFGGRHASTRWDVDCAYGLCHECHMHTHQDEPTLLMDYVIETYGQDFLDRMIRQNNEVKRWTQDEKLALLDFLRA